MAERVIQNCVVPYCYNCWSKFAEGKLFLFHSGTASSEPTKVWLCESCYASWDVTLDEKDDIVLQPIARKAAA